MPGSFDGAFKTPPRRSRKRPLYTLHLIAVTTLILLLPLLYLAVVGGVGYAWWWYVQNGWVLSEAMTSSRGRVLSFGGPLIIGATLLVFLIKPLVARPAEQPQVWRLDPDGERRFHAFVRALCAAQGAPVPSRIDVDLRVNASAHFRRGLASLFSRDLVLTLGLPLVACLEGRQLAAVLSHEFGHFSQTVGMRCYYLIMRVNDWFGRVVFGRDRWDTALEASAESMSGCLTWQLGFVLYAARGSVWLTRRLLHGLLLIGHRLSMGLSREMEFDADAHSVRVVGDKVFRQAMGRIVLADAAWQGSLDLAGKLWNQQRLPDDLPALTRRQLATMPADGAKQLVRAHLDHNPGMYASHPPLKERYAHATELQAQGEVDLDGPARELFDDFDGVCQTLTRAYFEEHLGDLPDQAFLSAVEVEGEVQRQARGLDARLDLFGPDFEAPTLLTVTAAEANLPRAVSREDWLEIYETPVEVPIDREALGELDERQFLTRTGWQLMELGVKIVPLSFGLQNARSKEAAAAAAKRAGEELDAGILSWREVGMSKLDRARAALALAETAGRTDLGLAGAHALRALADLGPLIPSLERLRRSTGAFQRVISAMEGKPVEDATRDLNWLIQPTRDGLAALAAAMPDAPYPYEDGPGDGTLAEALLPGGAPRNGDPWEAFRIANEVLTSTYTVYSRLLGHLSEAVLGIEQELARP